MSELLLEVTILAVWFCCYSVRYYITNLICLDFWVLGFAWFTLYHACHQISQAFPVRICMLQMVRDWKSQKAWEWGYNFCMKPMKVCWCNSFPMVTYYCLTTLHDCQPSPLVYDCSHKGTPTSQHLIKPCHTLGCFHTYQQTQTENDKQQFVYDINVDPHKHEYLSITSGCCQVENIPACWSVCSEWSSQSWWALGTHPETGWPGKGSRYWPHHFSFKVWYNYTRLL